MTPPRSRRSKSRDGQAGWLASLLGAAVLIVGGFALGLVAGVVSEEPELVVRHLAGRGEQVPWLPDVELELTAGNDTDTGAAGRVSIPSDDAAELAAPEADEVPEAVLRLPDVAAAAGGVRGADHSEPEAVVAARTALRARSEPSDRVGFAVQVGAFADVGAADRVYQKLRGKGFDVYIIPASKSEDGRSRVRVGPVESKADAQALASRLKREERLPTWVLSEGGS